RPPPKSHFFPYTTLFRSRKEVQLSRRRDLRVEHAHSSGRRISWICEYFPANPFLLPVQLFERFPRHHHFPANLEIRSQLRFFQRDRKSTRLNSSHLVISY